MKKLLLAAFVIISSSLSMAQGWKGSLHVGAAVPAHASDNAPSLSTSFSAGIRAVYFPQSMPVGFTAMLDGIHWIHSSSPTRSAVPMDDGLYVSRALHFPLTVGVWYPFWTCRNASLAAYAAIGAHWRNVTCKRMAAPGVMDDMEEHGWGFAWKVGAEFVIWERFSLAIGYTALGNPFGSGGDPLPVGTGPIEEGVRRSQPTLDGFGQGFLNISLGYWIGEN